MSEEIGGLGNDDVGLDGGLDTPTPPTDNVSKEIENLIPEWAKDFKVDKELLIDPSLKAIKDVDSLVKSYVHAQRQLGKKGVLIPSENSTKEEWDTFYQKIGVPLDDKAYKESLKLPKESVLGEHFGEEFAKMAHELRVSPKQAAKLYEFFDGQTKVGAERNTQEYTERVTKELTALKNHYGADAYQVGLAKANRFLVENVGKEFMEHLKGSGLANDAKVVDAFIKIASKHYGEETIPNPKGNPALSKEAAQREINQVMGNFDDPYHKTNHPDHKRRVDEIQKLFALFD
jgi:hypothetical protein